MNGRKASLFLFPGQENERDRLYREFELARQMERQNGRESEVCLAGEHYYDALIGCLLTDFPPHLLKPCKTSGNYFEFRGIRVFKTHAFKTGFIMGSHEFLNVTDWRSV